ncbi:MAG: 2-succinyl-5-enolpyruvyl-6-hydroxy-3-cyclohexene-1-carboxylic-acid synthase [Anaerolineae bacterium]|nr:2-succinyl-5-enolpyruvyl-6-hydroxy-3-cyclohexene-1-carboxylic-acid synthase [Anaerolineae bacterium]
MKTEYATYLYVTAFVDELVRAGLHNVVICPGSRSTPLAMIFAQRQATKADIHIWMHADERSAAFFALGMAKASGNAVAVVCTSGTAAANFLPAVVEAYYSRVPLVVLTADRPPELRDIGAPQTIDQLRLFGTHAKWFAEMALPEGTTDLLRYARVMANRSVAEATSVPAGPVHLNFPLREPLVPIPVDELPLLPRQDDQPYTQVETGTHQFDAQTVERLSRELLQHPHGLIICGSAYRHDPEFPAAVSELAKALRYPILADPLSGVRCGDHADDAIIDAYDAFLRDATFVERIVPDVVIRFGAAVTSKPLTQYLQRYPDVPQYIVDDGGKWNDPSLRASHMLRVDERWLCEALTQQLMTDMDDHDAARSAWFALWRETDRLARMAITDTINAFEATFEGRVYAELSALMPAQGVIFASSSMPVRDLDTFFPAQPRPIRFLANRGANGIDGVVSSALGASAISDTPMVLVIGDLGFFHDLNGLLAAKLHQIRATIVIVNNDGGGIFSFLPQAAHPEHFEQLFGTPHGLDFRHAAAMYGATYLLAEHWESFRDAIQRSFSGGLNIIEVRTNRQTNVTFHRQVWAAVSAVLPAVLEQIT